MSKNVDYSISKSSPIFIYGAGLLGTETCKRLLAEDYTLLGVIDRRGASVEAPVSVYRLGEEPFVSEACVCVCLAIGVEHFPVARQLYSRGYRRIFFLPLFLKSKAAKTMMTLYNRFVAGEYAELGNIPLYDELWKVNIEDYFIREVGDFVTVMVHSDHVYTGKEKRDEAHPFINYIPKATDESRLWFCDLPLGNRRVRSDMQTKLDRREDVRSLLENALFDGLEYFIDVASPAQYNPNGYFNLLDGHHRSSFLLKKKFKGIPLRVFRTDYEQYFQQEAANALMEYCKRLDSLPKPVKHPAFTLYPVMVSEADNEFTHLYSVLKQHYNKGES